MKLQQYIQTAQAAHRAQGARPMTVKRLTALYMAEDSLPVTGRGARDLELYFMCLAYRTADIDLGTPAKREAVRKLNIANSGRGAEFLQA